MKESLEDFRERIKKAIALAEKRIKRGRIVLIVYLSLYLLWILFNVVKTFYQQKLGYAIFYGSLLVITIVFLHSLIVKFRRDYGKN